MDVILSGYYLALISNCCLIGGGSSTSVPARYYRPFEVFSNTKMKKNQKKIFHTCGPKKE